MMRLSLKSTARTTLIATCASLALVAPRALADTTTSPAPPTFHVLHDDAIGALKLPAGQYSLTTFGGMTQAHAVQRFARFLRDFDGKLPAPWTMDAATATFTRGTTGFQATLVAAPPEQAPAVLPGSRCPGVFAVEHDDRIGGLRFPRGDFQVTSLRTTCAGNMNAFRRLLARSSTQLPTTWRLDAQTGTFSTAAGPRFRVKPVAETSGGSTAR